MTRIRQNDGIRIRLENGRVLAADATDPGEDLPLVSHAHGDHLYGTAQAEVVGSDLTRKLAAVRRNESVPGRLEPTWIHSLPAGHVPGSRAFLVDGDRRILYTGDISTRNRFGLTGFEPESADVLIVETTYGKPSYRFPGQAETEAEILDWLVDTMDQPVVLLGYALGRAQELLELADRAHRDRIRYSPAIEALNRPIEAAMDTSIPGSVASSFQPEPGDALVLPSRTGTLPFVETLRDDGALLAGFSGWAIDSNYRYARDLDAAFPLTDHCDFGELLEVVQSVDPDQVYTVHGFVDEFARAIQSRLGITAQPLKPGQTTLDEF